MHKKSYSATHGKLVITKKERNMRIDRERGRGSSIGDEEEEDHSPLMEDNPPGSQRTNPLFDVADRDTPRQTPSYPGSVCDNARMKVYLAVSAILLLAGIAFCALAAHKKRSDHNAYGFLCWVCSVLVWGTEHLYTRVERERHSDSNPGSDNGEELQTILTSETSL